jgi:Amidase
MPVANEKPVPPSSGLDFASIADLTEALRSRKLSASELVEHTIARVEVLDQRINAVVVRDFDRAGDAARVADAALARGPLLGVPVTVKEVFNVVGLPTTGGFPQFRNFVPAEDALIVSRLKQAGAIIIGKTNTRPDFAIFRATTISMGPPTTPGTSVGRLAAPRADQRRRSRSDLARSRSGRTSGDRYGYRHISAAFTMAVRTVMSSRSDSSSSRMPSSVRPIQFRSTVSGKSVMAPTMAASSNWHLERSRVADRTTGH